MNPLKDFLFPKENFDQILYRLVFPIFFLDSFFRENFRKTKNLLIKKMGFETVLDSQDNYRVPIFYKGRRYSLLIKKKEISTEFFFDVNDKKKILSEYGGPFMDFFYQEYDFQDLDLEDWDGKKMVGKLTFSKN